MGIVSSVARIPVRDRSADAIVNIFSPLVPDEFGRVLKDDGVFLRVVPREDHLIELKQAVYDKPYLNPPENGQIQGFFVKEKREIEYRVIMETNEDIVNLFQMTPYYYKTGRKDQQKLAEVNKLNVTFSFAVFLYGKEHGG